MGLSPERIRKNLVHIEFYTALVLFVIYLSESLYQYLYADVSFYIESSVYTVVLLTYASVYLLGGREGRHDKVMHALFIMMLPLFALLFVSPPPVFSAQLLSLNAFGHTAGIYLFFILPLYFVFALGAYAYRVVGRKRSAMALFAMGLLISLIFFGYLVTQFKVGDEVFLGHEAVFEMLHGANPYTTSVSSLLYSNLSTIGGTLTTNNTLIGTMDYPALFFLSYAPFYFLSQPTVYGLTHTGIKVQIAVFLCLFLATALFLADRKEIFKFRPEFIAFLVLLSFTLASATTLLMLSLILIAYARLGSRYAFIPLGLAVSTQQEMWIPAALLILYSLNNYGTRKAARDFLGALAVFLVINAYFMVQAPSAFFGGILHSIGNIIPFSSSPFSLLLLNGYNVGLSLSPALVLLSFIALAIMLLYWNRKELIPLFSLIPLVFVFHSVIGYYTLFILFLVIATTMVPKEGLRGRITVRLRRSKPIVYASILLILAIAIALTYQSHVSYGENFGIGVANQSIRFSGNSTLYSADVSYAGTRNHTVYLLLQGYSDNSTKYLLYGFVNDSIIGTKPECGAYYCLINVNRIMLGNGSGLHRLNAVINGSNESSRVTYINAVIYGGDYVYRSEGVYNLTT